MRLDGRSSSALTSSVIRAATVSYTHLDVYKRQVVQLFNVVHALVDHAAGKGTIADHRDHKPLSLIHI